MPEADFLVSAKSTPFPWVLSSSFTTSGEPLTKPIKLSVSLGRLAKAVLGIGILCLART